MLRASPVPHSLQSNASRPLPVHALLRLPARTSPRTPHALPFDSRQSASAFNQPLSFDTSSVTTMEDMFYVRSSLCPAPYLQSSPLLHAARAATALYALP